MSIIKKLIFITLLITFSNLLNAEEVKKLGKLIDKYNQEELLYFKENFFLDEVTSKLLSIRKIKKEDVNSFLKEWDIKKLIVGFPSSSIDMQKSYYLLIL